MGLNQQGNTTGSQTYSVIPRTLIFLSYHYELLLIKGAESKKRWAGLYNGIGGHLKRGEDVYTGALRELAEETGLKSNDLPQLHLTGTISIDTPAPNPGILIFVFIAQTSNRIQTFPSDEGTPYWVDWKHLPSTLLVEDLPTLIPVVLAAYKTKSHFFARYWYDKVDKLHMEFHQ